MKRLKNFARRAGLFLVNSIFAAVFAVAFLLLLAYALEEPLPHAKTLQFSDACFGRGI